jgi:hypothetical protein
MISRVSPCANFSSLVILWANISYFPKHELAAADRALVRESTPLTEKLSTEYFTKFRSILESVENLAEVVAEFAQEEELLTVDYDASAASASFPDELFLEDETPDIQNGLDQGFVSWLMPLHSHGW